VVEHASQWETEARPFWIYRISLTLLGQAGVIALDWLQAEPVVVGAYAAAMGTAAIAQVLATATNRVYASRLSILLEHREFEALFALRRKRLQWLVLPLMIYLLGTLVFTRELLGLFRPEFVDQGVGALRLLAATTAFTVLLSLAPTYLKFRRRNRATYTTVAIAAAFQIGLLLLLVPPLGATGAACAYAVSTCGMYGAFALMAHGDLQKLRVESKPP
jgi:O-antigen/teichoic acid export membrane protein